MEEPLLQNDTDFEITKESLINLFTLQNLNARTNLELYKNIGGAPGLMRSLKTSIEFGLDSTLSKQMEERKRKYGSNINLLRPVMSFWNCFAEAMNSNIMKILLFLATIILPLNIWVEGGGIGWIESAAIYSAVILIVFFSATNTYWREQVFDSLDFWRLESQIILRRNGGINTISKHDLLVGDLILLTEGDIVPADCVLVNGLLLVDQRHFTKNPEKVAKSFLKQSSSSPTNLKRGIRDDDPFLVSGSKVMKGSGEALVCAVGQNSQIFHLNMVKSERPNETPTAQKKLERIADTIGLIGIYIAIACLISMIGNQIVMRVFLQEEVLSLSVIKALLDFVILCIVIVIVAFPSGIPLAMAITFKDSIKNMLSHHLMVKNLRSCEQLAECNCICIDKTAGLTMNQMKLRECLFDGEYFDRVEHTLLSPLSNELMGEGICLNTSAHLVDDPLNPRQFKRIGSELECALLEYANSIGFNYSKIREKERIFRQIPFHKESRIMITVVEKGMDKFRIYMKGSFETVIESCKSMLHNRGEEVLLTSELHSYLSEQIKKMLTKGRKVMAFAYKDIHPSEFDSFMGYNDNELDMDFFTNQLNLVGIVAIEDPIRPDVSESIRICKMANITVRMITSEDKETAINIAKACDIINDEDLWKKKESIVLDGEQIEMHVGGIEPYFDIYGQQLQRMKYEYKFMEIANDLRVLARAASRHKLLLVIGLTFQSLNIVGMTGHEAQDSESMRKAHIGFAMGHKGTDVAKEAADIILMEDNFSAIVYGIKWGRNIYQSIRKLVQFQITANIVVIITVFLGTLIFGESPMHSCLLLYINLIIDILACFGLPSNQPSDKILNGKPFGAKKPIISSSMWRFIVCMSLYQISILLFLMMFAPALFNFPLKSIDEIWSVEKGKLNTILYSTYFFMQIFSFILSRKLKSYESNLVLVQLCDLKVILVFVLIFAFQYLLVNYGKKIIQCAPLTLYEHLFCLTFASSSILIWLLMKLLPKRYFSYHNNERGDQAENERLLFQQIRGDSLVPGLIHNQRKAGEDDL